MRALARRAPTALVLSLVLSLAVRATARAEEGETEADAAVRAALAKEFAFGFDETPLAKVLEEIAGKAGVEIVLDPYTLDGAGGGAISWHSEKSSAARALRWVTRLADLAFTITDGAVLVAERTDFVGEVVLRLYDVRDLSRDALGRQGPLVGFAPDDATDAPYLEWYPESIAELVSTRVRPGRWDASLGTSIEEREGVLVVLQTSDVHAQVEALLAGLCATRPRGVTVEVVVIAADAVRPAEGHPREGAAGPDELARIVARAGGDATIARATLATLDGRAAHTIWGAKTHYVASKGLQWPEVKDERFYNDRMEYQIVLYSGDEGPKAIVVKTPSPPPALPPPGEGVVVPYVDALLDGVLIEATPRLGPDRRSAEIDLRVVIFSRPREVPEAHVPEPDEIQTPAVDYSRLAMTTRVPVA
ncbi:MAG: hypothetical protein ACYTKD_18820 [Planctomycetota bacterium]|jgi:hypothetical protein